MSENNQMMSVEGQLVGLPLAGPESFSQQQLDYLKRALGVDETVLMSTETQATANTEITLSEAYTNFRRIRIVACRIPNTGVTPLYQEFEVDSSHNSATFMSPIIDESNGNLSLDAFRAAFSDKKLTIKSITRKTFANTSFTTSTSSPLTIMKIVGVGRIAGGN